MALPMFMTNVENATHGSALRVGGGLSLGDVWLYEGWRPHDGLVMMPTSDGAVIFRAGRRAPAVIPVECTPATRGRTLHIGPGVDLTEVGAFVDSLPLDLRPANYTVARGVTFGQQP